jgi:GNAT superfamily N-acetyltransferase
MSYTLCSSVTIRSLADRPQAIPLLAGWFHDEWSSFDRRSCQDIKSQLTENLNRDAIPLTFLALQDSAVLGTVSLDLSDLPSHDHLSPWLASLFVPPEARGQGTGTALVRHAQDFARLNRIGPLYLWTPGSTRLYERCGWTEIERAFHGSRPITLMCFDA